MCIQQASTEQLAEEAADIQSSELHSVHPELDRLPVWCAGYAVEAGPVTDWLIEYSSSPCVWACTHAAW